MKVNFKPVLMSIHLLGKIKIITISKTDRTFDGGKNRLISFSSCQIIFRSKFAKFWILKSLPLKNGLQITQNIVSQTYFATSIKVDIWSFINFNTYCHLPMSCRFQTPYIVKKKDIE